MEATVTMGAPMLGASAMRANLAARADPTTGTLPGRVPYARVGSGDRALVVLPGFGDAMFLGVYPPGTGLALAPYFAAYLDEYAVYLLSRPRGLPAGYDADDAVAGHARAFEAIVEPDGEDERAVAVGGSAASNPGSTATGIGVGDPGSVDVIGISMGGLIAQSVARERPELVGRLVLANTACRLDPDARGDVRRMERYAREHDWFSIRSELARAMFSDGRRLAYPPLIQTIGRFVLPRPAEPADVWRSLEFILDYDGCDERSSIEQPTLVFGGERDPYFTESVARETATGIPDARLRLASGAKHAAFHERKLTFDSTVREFLDRT